MGLHHQLPEEEEPEGMCSVNSLVLYVVSLEISETYMNC